MTLKPIDELGEQQKTVMDIIWELGEVTVHDVRDRLNPDLAYTTVLSTLQQLEKAGWLQHRSEGRMNVYKARRSREREGARSLQQFTKRIFGGDPLLLFQHLLEDKKLTDEDLRSLRKMIDRERKERRDD